MLSKNRKSHFRKAVISSSLCAVIALSACGSEQAGNERKSDLNIKTQASDINPMLESLRRNFRGADIVAVIQHERVEVENLPDSDPDDQYQEQKQIYSARILQPIKGNVTQSIRYYMVVEKGEAESLNKAPFVVTLCEGKDGLYWPGVGADFPLTPEVKQWLEDPNNLKIERAEKSTLCD